jgi:hypothetical protein
MNNLKSKLTGLAVALAAGIAATPALAEGDVLKSSTVEQISHSYGSHRLPVRQPGQSASQYHL